MKNKYNLNNYIKYYILKIINLIIIYFLFSLLFLWIKL